MRFSFPILLLLAWPFAEIAGFIVVGKAIGVLPTLALIVLTSILGSVLLRVQGLDVLRKLGTETDAGRVPARELVHGAMIVVAGFLLLIPGFITDILGFILFIPLVRDLGWRLIRNRVRINFTTFGGARGRGRSSSKPAGETIIDLDEEDYRREGDKTSPWRKQIEP